MADFPPQPSAQRTRHPQPGTPAHLRARNERMIKAVRAGQPVAEVARQEKLTAARVYQIVKRAGVELPGHKRSPVRGEVVRLRQEEGFSQRVIAREVGLSRARVREILAEELGEEKPSIP